MPLCISIATRLVSRSASAPVPDRLAILLLHSVPPTLSRFDFPFRTHSFQATAFRSSLDPFFPVPFPVFAFAIVKDPDIDVDIRASTGRPHRLFNSFSSTLPKNNNHILASHPTTKQQQI